MSNLLFDYISYTNTSSHRKKFKELIVVKNTKKVCYINLIKNDGSIYSYHDKTELGKNKKYMLSLYKDKKIFLDIVSTRK